MFQLAYAASVTDCAFKEVTWTTACPGAYELAVVAGSHASRREDRVNNTHATCSTTAMLSVGSCSNQFQKMGNTVCMRKKELAIGLRPLGASPLLICKNFGAAR